MLAARAGVVDGDEGRARLRRARGERFQRGSDVGERGGRGVRRHFLAEDRGIHREAVAAGIGAREQPDADAAEADERPRDADSKHEGQGPDADPIVPVRPRDLSIVARTQHEGVAQDARMRKHARQRQRDEHHPHDPDQRQPPDAGQRQIFVQRDDEVGPGMRRGRDEAARAIDIGCAVICGDDRARRVRGRHLDEGVGSARLARIARDRGGERGLCGGGGQHARFDDARRLPRFPAIVDHDQRTGQRDDIDQRARDQPDRGMAAERPLDKRRAGAAHDRPHKIVPAEAVTASGAIIRAAFARVSTTVASIDHSTGCAKSISASPSASPAPNRRAKP